MPEAGSYRKTLFFYYLYVFSYDFIFGYAIFPAFFQLQGSSPEMAGTILAFWAACIIVFKVPSGLSAPRLCSRSSTLGNDNAKRTHIITASWMILGHNLK